MKLRIVGNTARIEGLTPASIGAEDRGAALKALAKTTIQVLRIVGDSTVTGNLIETNLTEAIIPLESFTDNSIIEIYTLLSLTNSANSKTIRAYLGGVLIASISPITSRASLVISRTIFNKGRKNQISVSQFETFQVGASASAVQQFIIDTTVNVPFRLTGQLALASENIILRGGYLRITN